MINVYDWFESFQLVLETGRKHLRKKRRTFPETGSPRKGEAPSSPVKGKAKAGTRDTDEIVDEEERWGVEVQARFMRALQELDYLGFVKHTGRKPDHVLRTVFDVVD